MEQLRQITEEEQSILAGEGVQKERYTAGREFVIDKDKLLQRGRLIEIRPHTRFTAFPKHRHNYIEIMYMCEGQTTHVINDSSRIYLKKGELLFLNQHAWHAIEKTGAEDVAVNFSILPEFFDEAFGMMRRNNVLHEFLTNSLRQDGGEISYLHFHVADVLPVQNLVENLVWSLMHRRSGSHRMDQITMGLLVLHLLDCTDCLTLEATQGRGNAMVVQLLREVEENYREVSLNELAQKNHVSAAYLSRLVRETTGKTFKELLQHKRLSRAESLLRESRLPISDIITAVGYDNTSYFYRIFRERYGMSPAEYRNVK